ncbi:MAG: carbohydrate kinase family protein [Peptostreptococcaceae bacterium]|nr:carbohydrate kinase family protein [Peptostreptococcaceae bacterium]
MRISGVGCCLIDSIYMNCSYNDEAFQNLMSVKKGDGGLIEGGLVFSEDVEKFANKPYREILEELTSHKKPDVMNLGGPAVVALVHASQILAEDTIEVFFHGAVGKDADADFVHSSIAKTPLKVDFKIVSNQRTSTTDVFDDPSRRGGKGERSFLNTIGAAGFYRPEDIHSSFYNSDIILLGGTALVPLLHDGIATVLKRAKKSKCITVVGTVYDFRNEKKSPHTQWPLGKTSSYKNIDLLIADEQEAIRLSGKADLQEAAHILISYGVGALIITRGALDMIVYSGGSLINPCALTTLPVSHYMDELIINYPPMKKDTTGCGDNFVGGVLVALAKHQLKKDNTLVNMRDVCAYGAASGGLTLTYHGGTYHEQMPGEKAALLQPIVEAYFQTVGELK